MVKRSGRRIFLAAALVLVAAALTIAAVRLGWTTRGESLEVPDVPLGQLRSLGYVTEVDEDRLPGQSGVVRHDPERAWAGVNAYCSVLSTEVRFLDMDGRELHRLHLESPGTGQDCLVEPDGDGVLVVSQPFVRRLDWQSHVSWSSDREHHHDVDVAPDGSILTLSGRPATLPYRGIELPIWNEGVLVFDRGGRLRRELWLADTLADRIARGRLEQIWRYASQAEPGGEPLPPADVFHVNGIVQLTQSLGVAPAGDWLISARELSLLAILDPENGSVVWSWGPGELDRPHDPSVLPNGNLLVFDNGWQRGYSRIVELDPRSRRIVWQYRADPPESFFSQVRGSVQALPNGDRLITESAKGRVFEVTREGEIVWEFLNPDTVGPDAVRRQIYRMVRLSQAQWDELRSSADAPASSEEAAGGTGR